ncbi:MAG: hypothetical protein Q4C42_01395, partial [Clostridia bacterium]|nr:hypothetical protein [Clostridia bacterium]
MADPNRIIRRFAFFLEIFVLCIIQDVPNLIPELFGSFPLLTLAAALSISVIEEEIPAMLFGLEAGLLL